VTGSEPNTLLVSTLFNTLSQTLTDLVKDFTGQEDYFQG